MVRLHQRVALILVVKRHFEMIFGATVGVDVVFFLFVPAAAAAVVLVLVVAFVAVFVV